MLSSRFRLTFLIIQESKTFPVMANRFGSKGSSIYADFETWEWMYYCCPGLDGFGTIGRLLHHLFVCIVIAHHMLSTWSKQEFFNERVHAYIYGGLICLKRNAPGPFTGVWDLQFGRDLRLCNDQHHSRMQILVKFLGNVLRKLVWSPQDLPDIKSTFHLQDYTSRVIPGERTLRCVGQKGCDQGADVPLHHYL